MRKIANAVMNLSLVLVPVALLVWGIIIADSSYWQYTLGIGIAAFACFTYERYMQAKKSEKKRAAYFEAQRQAEAQMQQMRAQVSQSSAQAQEEKKE